MSLYFPTPEERSRHTIFPGVTVHDADRYPLELLQEACSDLGSRLFLRIREQLGLAYYVFCHHQSYDDTGTLFSQSGVDIKRIDLAVQTILREFGKLLLAAAEGKE